MVNGVLVDVENLRDCFRVVRRFVTLYQQFPCFIVQHFYHLLCLLYTCCKGVTAFVRSAIDNAIEYESRIKETEKRLIKVSVFSENHFLVIKISNYCEETILKSLEDPETTKENPEIHGYGIKGIRLAVEKYEGHMTIKQENNWFIVSILIPIPEKQNQTAL